MGLSSVLQLDINGTLTMEILAGSVIAEARVEFAHGEELFVDYWFWLNDNPALVFYEGVFSWAGTVSTSHVEFTGSIRGMPPPMVRS